jgi:putative sterol carrier protein
MTFEEMFSVVKQTLVQADLSQVHTNLAVQVNITGQGAGVFYAALQNGHLSVQPKPYRGYDVKLTASANDFIAMLQGRLNVVGAFTSGRLRIDGNFKKAMELKQIIEAIGRKNQQGRRRR